MPSEWRSSMIPRRQGASFFSAILVLVATTIMIQLWLVAAALDALLSRDHPLLLPAALASLVIFAFNGLLLLFALSFDRRAQSRRYD